MHCLQIICLSQADWLLNLLTFAPGLGDPVDLTTSITEAYQRLETALNFKTATGRVREMRAPGWRFSGDVAKRNQEKVGSYGIKFP